MYFDISLQFLCNDYLKNKRMCHCEMKIKCDKIESTLRVCSYLREERQMTGQHFHYLRQGGIKIATVCPSVRPSVQGSVRLLAGLR